MRIQDQPGHRDNRECAGGRMFQDAYVFVKKKKKKRDRSTGIASLPIFLALVWIHLLTCTVPSFLHSR